VEFARTLLAPDRDGRIGRQRAQPRSFLVTTALPFRVAHHLHPVYGETLVHQIAKGAFYSELPLASWPLVDMAR
jgi:hypothetical protein